MGKYALYFAVVLTSLVGCMTASKARDFTLQDVQGYWWESCSDPAAQFAIRGDRYFGDFEGEFKVGVAKDMLVIDPDSDSTPAYRILTTSPQHLVLRLASGPPHDWVLRSCPAASGRGS
jgi:hypothetical protein